MVSRDHDVEMLAFLLLVLHLKSGKWRSSVEIIRLKKTRRCHKESLYSALIPRASSPRSTLSRSVFCHCCSRLNADHKQLMSSFTLHHIPTYRLLWSWPQSGSNSGKMSNDPVRFDLLEDLEGILKTWIRSNWCCRFNSSHGYSLLLSDTIDLKLTQVKDFCLRTCLFSMTHFLILHILRLAYIHAAVEEILRSFYWKGTTR